MNDVVRIKNAIVFAQDQADDAAAHPPPAAPPADAADAKDGAAPPAVVDTEIDEPITKISDATLLFGSIAVIAAAAVLFYVLGGTRVARRLLAKYAGVGRGHYEKLDRDEA